MQLYWGDIHNHCGISYGFGGLENALHAAREQLDFCAITGHATWHDIHDWQPEIDFLIGFHKRGFARLAADWARVVDTIDAANAPGEFVTFQSYEAHSRQYGDHHVLSPSSDLPILEAPSPQEMLAGLGVPAIIVPHHIAYVPGYRGIDWDAFDGRISPFVEVYSKHGCGMSDDAPYPYLHTMGARDGRNTVRSGLAQGKRFSYAGSTDHHAGYPGSYGDGRTAVLAEALTRASLWEALLAGRLYAVTGDKIACQFSVNGQPFGSQLSAGSRRQISLAVRACDALDRVTVLKNNRPLWAIGGHELPDSSHGPYKVRVELGWGDKAAGHDWEATVRLDNGSLRGVEPCFRGQSVLAPTQGQEHGADINALDNRIVSQSVDAVTWRCTTFKNPSTLHPATAAVILELDGDASTRLTLTANGRQLTASLPELLTGSRGMHMQEWSSECALLHRAVPESCFTLDRDWTDEPESEHDVYDVEVRQANLQMAWVSPIFCTSR